MGLLQKLKSALGLGGAGSSEGDRSGNVDVTVEREPSTADEDAVKGTETASSGDGATPESGGDGGDEPSADGSETLADDSEADDASGDETDSAAEEPEADSVIEEAEAAETADTDESTEEAEAADTDESAETADTAGSTDPVTELKGIGPAYGDRLAGAGVETVGELAGADPSELADRIDLGESRVTGWIDQANDY